MISPYICAGLEGIADDFLDPICNLIVEMCDSCSGFVGKLEGIDVFLGNSQQFIVSAATTLGTLLLAIELCSQAMGFHFEDINEGFRFVFKLVVYKIVMENSSNIASIVYGLFVTSTNGWAQVESGFTSVGEGVKVLKDNIYKSVADGNSGFLGTGKLLILILMVFATGIIIVLLVKICISLAGVIFELAIDIAVAPIPIATLVCHETRQIGINYIKGFSANCLTIAMYGICFNVYSDMVGKVNDAFTIELGEGSGWANSAAAIIPVIVGLLLLSTATKNAGNMMSKILG